MHPTITPSFTTGRTPSKETGSREEERQAGMRGRELYEKFAGRAELEVADNPPRLVEDRRIFSPAPRHQGVPHQSKGVPLTRLREDEDRA